MKKSVTECGSMSGTEREGLALCAELGEQKGDKISDLDLGQLEIFYIKLLK